MKPKRILALLLCAAMLFSALYGCNEAVVPPEDPPVEDVTAPEAAEDAPGVDFEAAFAAFPPDTIMITAGELDITWAELFFFLYGNVNSLISSFGVLPDLSTASSDGRTYAEVIMDFTIDSALQFLTFEYGANISGVKLSEEDQAMLDKSLESMLESTGSEEALQDAIWNYYGIRDIELFKNLLLLDYMPLAIFTDMFGKGAEIVSDEDAATLTADGGYLMAKHILRLRTAEEATEETPEETAEKTAVEATEESPEKTAEENLEENENLPLREIEDILRQLNDYDGDDFGGFFDELMIQHTEDTDGLSMFGDGYLFQPGDMEEAFYKATEELEIGAISDIVETAFGYHIILRVPVDYDATPFSLLLAGDTSTLRMLAAFELFDPIMTSWRDSLEPVYSTEFESIVLSDLFVAAEG